MTDFVSKAFAILDFCDERIKKSLLGEKIAGKLALEYNDIATCSFFVISTKKWLAFSIPS